MKMMHNCNNCNCHDDKTKTDVEILNELKMCRDDMDRLIKELELRVATEEEEKEKSTEEILIDFKAREELLKALQQIYPYHYYTSYLPQSNYTTKINYPMWYRM